MAWSPNGLKHSPIYARLCVKQLCELPVCNAGKQSVKKEGKCQTWCTNFPVDRVFLWGCERGHNCKSLSSRWCKMTLYPSSAKCVNSKNIPWHHSEKKGSGVKCHFLDTLWHYLHWKGTWQFEYIYWHHSHFPDLSFMGYFFQSHSFRIPDWWFVIGDFPTLGGSRHTG